MAPKSPFSKLDYNSHFNRRAKWWDYKKPCFYLITILKQKWVPKFAEIPSMYLPRPKDMVRSESGRVIDAMIQNFNRHYKDIAITAYVIMPDHIHMTVHVKAPIPEPLGVYMNKFKASCSREYASRLSNRAATEQAPAGSQPAPSSPTPNTELRSIFTDGFNDRILLQPGQLQRWNWYIHDNPRRLQMLRAHPDLFSHRHRLTIDGIEYAVLGNINLLRNPDRCTVRHSSRFTEADIAARKLTYRLTAHNRGAFISPFIHPNEKAVRQEALRQGASIIHIRHNGFPERWKPSGEEFELCTTGRLLIIAPVTYEPLKEKSALSRTQCLAMNAFAERIAALTTDTPLTLRTHHRP